MRMCQQRFYLTSLNVATIFVIEFNVYYFALFCTLVAVFIVVSVLVLHQLSEVAHRLLPHLSNRRCLIKKSCNHSTACCNSTHTTKSGAKNTVALAAKNVTLTAKHRNNGCHFGEIFCCCLVFLLVRLDFSTLSSVNANTADVVTAAVAAAADAANVTMEFVYFSACALFLFWVVVYLFVNCRLLLLVVVVCAQNFVCRDFQRFVALHFASNIFVVSHCHINLLGCSSSVTLLRQSSLAQIIGSFSACCKLVALRCRFAALKGPFSSRQDGRQQLAYLLMYMCVPLTKCFL